MKNTENGIIVIDYPKYSLFPDSKGNIVEHYGVVIMDNPDDRLGRNNYYCHFHVNTISTEIYMQHVQMACDYAFKHDMAVQVNNRQVMGWIEDGVINTSGMTIIKNNEEIAKDHYIKED